MSEPEVMSLNKEKKQQRDGRRFCSICGDVYDKDDDKLATFLIRKEWIELVPALQKNLSEKSRICCRHFEETDILKGRIIQDIYYPFMKWRLVKNAIPKLLLGKIFCEKFTKLVTFCFINYLVHVLECQTNKGNKPTTSNINQLHPKQKQSVKTPTILAKRRTQPTKTSDAKKQKLQATSSKNKLYKYEIHRYSLLKQFFDYTQGCLLLKLCL